MPTRRILAVPDILQPQIHALRAMRAYLRGELVVIQRQMQTSYGRIPMIPVLRVRLAKNINSGWSSWEPEAWPDFTAVGGYDGRAMRAAEFTISGFRRFKGKDNVAINRLGIIQTWSQGVPQRAWLKHHGVGRGKDGKRNDMLISDYRATFNNARNMIEAHALLGEYARDIIHTWRDIHDTVTALGETTSIQMDYAPWTKSLSMETIEGVLTRLRRGRGRNS